MSPGKDAPTGPTENNLEKQEDSLMGRRVVFQYEKGFCGKKAGKAGNRDDTAYFILKRTGKPGYGVSLRRSDFFPLFPSCTWKRELKFATKGPFRYSDHIGNLLEIKELPNNGKLV